MIRAGTPVEANRHSGDWAFVDLGFAERAKSCGLLLGEGEPEEVTFSCLRKRLLKFAASGSGPINLLIEAPLSVAFNEHGNPTGRVIEKRGSETRYWYVGLGCCVLVAATHLLRAIHDANAPREIRLFEGLASFKPKDGCSSHSDDVIKLRGAVWGVDSASDVFVAADKLASSPKHQLVSAFVAVGMDFGVPAVVALGG